LLVENHPSPEWSESGLISTHARPLPKASQPEEVGFSTERLNLVAEAFHADVDKGLIPGAVVLIARNGKVAYLETVGFRDRDK
jgi:CubicO group peptidase (beta-lactamase class C family)